jgi:hypothetical protein
MNRLLLQGAALLLAAALASACGTFPTETGKDTSSSQTGGPASQSTDGESSGEEKSPLPLGSGSILYAEDVAPLEADQEQLLLDYMNTYYESLARLSPGDPASLFTADAAAQAEGNRIIWEYVIGIREMQRTDLSLTAYHYTLTITGVETAEDGKVSVSAEEDSVQNFAAHPQVDSQSFGVRHQFTLADTAQGWLLERHMQMDSLYFRLMGRSFLPGGEGEAATGAAAVRESYERQLELLLEEAQADTALRLNRGSGEEKTADHPYDRQAAVEYAHTWTGVRNDQWPDYSRYGGNCQNFVSQCLLAGGIPMDPYGQALWKWYGETPNNFPGAAGRSASWSAVDEFLSYAQQNDGYGLSATADAPYYSGQPGDIIHLGTGEDWRHTVLIVDTVEQDGETVDYLVDSNTADLRNFPVSAYAYTSQMLIRIWGWND